MKNSVSCMVVAFAVLSASAAGCVVPGAEAEGEVEVAGDTAEVATTNAGSFVLSLTTEVAGQNQVSVTSSDGTPRRICQGQCNFAYLAGASLSLRVPFPTDNINCIRFSGWTGACAGQGTTCNLVLNSNLTTEAIWRPFRPCTLD